MAEKTSGLRLFGDADGKMNLALADVGGAVLVVSQFTLYGNAEKGKRPSFIDAARPEEAIPLYERFLAALRERGSRGRERRVRRDDGCRARERRTGDAVARAVSELHGRSRVGVAATARLLKLVGIAHEVRPANIDETMARRRPAPPRRAAGAREGERRRDA